MNKIPFGRFQSRRDAVVNGCYYGSPVSDQDRKDLEFLDEEKENEISSSGVLTPHDTYES